MRISVSRVLTLAMLVALYTSGRATAITLATSGNALPTWQGSQSYVAAGALGQTLDATIEYAVFAPGDFQEFLTTENNIQFADPAPSEFIYAYQITDIVSATAGITIFTVGLDDDESTGISGVTYIPKALDHDTYSPLPTNDPAFLGPGPGGGDSSQWGSFGALTTGGASAILFYSSPQGPEFGFSSLTAGTASTFVSLSMPNPVAIPEPTTTMLLTCAVVILARVRRRIGM